MANIASKGTFDTLEQEHRWTGQYTPEVDIWYLKKGNTL